MAPGLRLYTLFVPEIKAHLERRDFTGLKKILNQLSPFELAEGWMEFAESEKIKIFRLLALGRALQLFEELEEKDQQFIVEHANNPEFLDFSPPLIPLGDRFLKQLQAQIRKTKLPFHRPFQGQWPENSAGRLMKRDFFCVEPGIKANQALERLQASTKLKNVGDLNALYVTDKEGRLLGILSLRTLIAAPPDSKIADILWPVGILKVRPETDQEEVANLFRKYNLTTLPIVDHGNKLLGIITLDDVLDVLHEEATEDIAKMAGTQSAELSQWKIWSVVKLRMPWLLITCLGQYFVAHAIHRFEGTLSRFIALASFMPLIAAMGGNVGTQSSTIAVRALASGDWHGNDLGRAIKRDVLVGLLLGLIYGLIGGILAFGLYGFRFGETFPLVVFIGMFTSITMAAAIGAAAPFLFNHMGIDPATSSGPLVTTGTDLISVTIYLFVASFLLARP